MLPYDEEVAIHAGDACVYCTVRSHNDRLKFEIEFEPNVHKWLTDPVLAYDDNHEVKPLGDLHVDYLHKKLSEYIEKIKREHSDV